MRYIFLDTETTHLTNDPDIDKEQDILIQLSYAYKDDTGWVVSDTKCNPGTEISVGCMAIHLVTNEDIVGLPKYSETDNFKKFKSLIESRDFIVVAHNAEFDVEVMRRAGVNIKKYCNVIDTVQIAKFINDQDGLKLEQNKLNYLKYYYRLDKLRPRLNQMLNITENMYHNALSDIADLILYFQWVKNTHKVTDEIMIELSENPFKLNYIPFGKNRGDRFEDLSYNQLKWYVTLDDKNVSYTASLFI